MKIRSACVYTLIEDKHSFRMNVCFGSLIIKILFYYL